MKNKIILFVLTSFWIFNTNAQITPYERPFQVEKISNVGVYPKIKDTAAWDGRIIGDYNIKFKINGLKTGDTVYLADHHIGGKYLRDTAVVDEKGIAAFKGNKLLQRGMYLFVLPEKRDYFELLIGDDQDFQITCDTSWYNHSYYRSWKVKGCDENEQFLEYQLNKIAIIERLIEVDKKLAKDSSDENIDKWTPVRQEILKEKNNYDSVFIAQHPGNILSRFLYSMFPIDIPKELPILEDGTRDSSFTYKYYKAHYWDHVDLNEDALVRMPVNILKNKLDLYFDKVIIPDADSCIDACNFLLQSCKNSIENEKYIIWYLTNRFESSKIMGLDRVFVHMALSQYCQGRAWWVDSNTVSKMCDNAYRRSHSLIGATGADLELRDEDSIWINTNSFKAPYTILMFWDPTCGHCKEVMPKVIDMYEKYKEKGWKVITLASGDKKKEWYKYLKDNPKMDYFTNLIRGEVRAQKYADALYSYYVIASPTLYILDENKKIVANRIDAEKIPEFIEHLDEEKAAKKD